MDLGPNHGRTAGLYSDFSSRISVVEREIVSGSTTVVTAVVSASQDARAQLTFVTKDTPGHVESVHKDYKNQEKETLISEEICNRFRAVVRTPSRVLWSGSPG